jgi:hypothetical protein
MRSFIRGAFVVFVLSAGCTNFSTDKTGSQQVEHDGAQFVPSNSWGAMNGEPMDMRRR